MLDYRKELRKIRDEKLEKINLSDPEDIFKKVFIPYFITLSVKQIEKGVEVFVHYHERAIIIGANKRMLLHEHNISDAKSVVNSLKEMFEADNNNTIFENFEDGFAFTMKP